MSEEIQVVQVGAAGAALAQASAALALQYKNETSTLKGQVDTAKAAVDVAKAAVDVAKGQVDTAKAAVDVAKEAVDLSQADVIARQAVVVAAQATTEGARDTAVAQAGVATTKATEAAGSASLALAIFGTADNLNAAQQIMLGYATTAQGASSQAQAYAASAASVAQQDLSGVTAAALHRSPNAVTAMCVYDTSKDSDGGAWVERCSHLSWASETLNGTWINSTQPGFMGIGAAATSAELTARAMGGTLGAELLVNGDFSNGVVGWGGLGGGSIAANATGGADVLTVGSNGASKSFASEVGASYLVTGRVSGAQAGRVYINDANSTASTEANVANLSGFFAFVTSAIAATTYVILGSTNSNVTVSFDDISVKKVLTLAPSGSFYQNAADGKCYRLYKNLLANSGFQGGTSGTWGSGAVAPTGWAAASGTGAVTFSASSRYAGEQQVQYVATAQRPYLQSGNITFPANTTVVMSAYVETLASGTPTIIDVLALGSAISGATTTYRKNGGAATSASTFTTGDFLEVIVTTASTSGTVPIRHGLGANGNATGDVTLSAPQVEYVSTSASLATAYESKAAGVGSQSEVFRGNKAKFPRLSAIVAEAASVTIYDLTEPGWPMWMRCVGAGTSQSTSNMLGSVSITNSSVCAVQGKLILGDSTAAGGYCVRVIDFGNDFAVSYRQTAVATIRYNGGIALRHGALGWSIYGSAYPANSNIVNAVAACVMPDAPVDPVTGLQVPTIACFTAGGISIIQNDGTVRNSSSTSSFGYGSINKDVLVAGSSSSSTIQYALKPGSLGASFGTTSIVASAAPGFNEGVAIPQAIGIGRSLVVNRTGAKMSMMRLNETTPGQSLVAHIAPTYNTGWWCGDIRRVWCADTVTGTASSGEKVNEPSFDATGNWLAGTVGSATAASIAAGQVNLPRTDGSNYSYVYQTLTLEGNKTYTLTVVNGGAGGITALVGTAALDSTMGTLGVNAGATGVLQVTATQASVVLTIRSANDGTTGVATSASVVEGVLDRCYKAKPATIYGTLARTAVAAAAQLVFYTGWSAANHLQEAYSADLDPATGNLAVRAWGTIPTNVAAAGWALDRSAATGAYYRLGHSATGQIVGELYDGTTTRTVTTTATYATSQPLEFGMEYVPNGASSTLTLKVGGRQVAQSTFAALNSLSNATAVATVGIDRALTAPWAGGLALVKVGMTAASANASAWMFELEKQMFRPGAKVTLPSASSLVDVSYDEATDTVSVVDAANEAHFVGMVRVSTAAVPAGAFSKVARGGGLKLVARTGTNPGVDVTVPAQNLREELRRGEEAARRARLSRVFDFDSVTGQADFSLPPGWEAIEVMSAGASKREGATKDWTRFYDGFVETVRFGVSPGSGAWVQVTARRAA